MALPAPNLDTLRFQKDLVDVARKRIIQYCPEWTEYNVSDPGITLIELFAWMTEQTVYRLNQVPHKNYIKFLDMLGIQLEPPVPASTDLSFYLSTPFPLRPDDPSDQTKVIIKPQFAVSTMTMADGSSITFTTDKEVEIVVPKLVHLRRMSAWNSEAILSETRHEHAHLSFQVFEQIPDEGWAFFYLGFDPKRDISGHIIQLDVNCEPAQGSGIVRDKPPWVWRACVDKQVDTDDIQESLTKKLFLNDNGNDRDSDGYQWRWIELGKSKEEQDTTGGFNNESGHLTLYLPPGMQPTKLRGIPAYWMRCGLKTKPEKVDEPVYQRSPVITLLRAWTSGVTIRATNAIPVEEELLGVSNGDPGQMFTLQQKPLLEPDDRKEIIEIREQEQHKITDPDDEGWVPWQRVDNFAHSREHDRHYILDLATGEVYFGPAVRQSNGAMRQYGRIPSMNAQIRMKRYRYSSGAKGNVPIYALRLLHENVPYLDRVTNWERVYNGRDQETLEEAMMRARRKMRAQNRAVTAADYELLVCKDDRSIARAKCIAPRQMAEGEPMPSRLEIRLVPAVYEAIQTNDFTQLALSSGMIRRARQRLDSLRLLTSGVTIKEPRYMGVFLDIQIVTAHQYEAQEVEESVNLRLRSYVTPLRPVELYANGELDLSDPEKINIVIDKTSDPAIIRAQVDAALQNMAQLNRPLNSNGNDVNQMSLSSLRNTSASDDALPAASPSSLYPDRLEPEWTGWEFGQPLRIANLFSIVRDAPGVKHVLKVAMYQLCSGQDANNQFFDLLQYDGLVDPPPEEAEGTGDVQGESAQAQETQNERRLYWRPISGNELFIAPDVLLCSPINHRITTVIL